MTHDDFARLDRLAGDLARYPEADNLIDMCASRLTIQYGEATALQMVRDMFAGLTEADVRGLISVGDEHEWAAIALRANSRAYATRRPGVPL